MGVTDTFPRIVQWITQQQERMTEQVRHLCEINSGTDNLAGLAAVTSAIMPSLRQLGGTVRLIDLPPRMNIDEHGEIVRQPLAPAISICKHSVAACRVFLGIHIDTVYPVDSSFRGIAEVNANRWVGPGVVDAKGGLVVMLTALAALEQSLEAGRIGWEVLINTDEEVGSPGSASLFAEAAGRNHLGLIFEPALPDGNLVSTRKGSWNYALVVRGKSAHVGRDIATGRNALHTLAKAMTEIVAMQNLKRGISVNFGKIDGGGPSNVVPDLAIGRFNIRTETIDDHAMIDAQLRLITEDLNRDGIFAELHETAGCPPKPMTPELDEFLHFAAGCGSKLGLDLSWRGSGGVCDGNRLAAAGLPTIDTLGPRGGNLHSHDEYIQLDSLVERACLSALILSHAEELRPNDNKRV